MTEEKYKEINYLLKEMADDLDLNVDTFTKVYIGGGEVSPHECMEVQHG